MNSLMNDCSMTTMRIAAPSSMMGVTDFHVQAADDMIRSLGFSSLNVGSERTGDIIRWGTDNNRHFANVLFTGDDGISKIFSRSGKNGRFEMINVDNGDFIKFYGPITGRYRPK